MRCTNPLDSLLPGQPRCSWLFLLVFSRDRGASSSVLLSCSIGLGLFFYSFFYFQGKETQLKKHANSSFHFCLRPTQVSTSCLRLRPQRPHPNASIPATTPSAHPHPQPFYDIPLLSLVSSHPQCIPLLHVLIIYT